MSAKTQRLKLIYSTQLFDGWREVIFVFSTGQTSRVELFFSSKEGNEGTTALIYTYIDVWLPVNHVGYV